MLDRRQRIASASLVGLAAAYTRRHRLDRDEVLDEVAEVLAAFAPDVRAAILADAAAAYVDGDRHYDEASAELLAAVGADLERARQIRAEHAARPNPLASVAVQANQGPRTGSEAVASFREQFYTDLERRGIHVSEAEREAARLRARAKLDEAASRNWPESGDELPAPAPHRPEP
jgi:hypothetical protein